MKKSNPVVNGAFALYGLMAYLLSLAAILYVIGFVDDLIVPKTIDRGGTEDAGVAVAICIDLALIALFGLQHSIMARPAFKRLWHKVVPVPVERSTYVVFSSAALGLLMWQWRPIDQTLWALPSPVSQIVLGISLLGWGIVLLSTFLLNHFELFGLRQTFAEIFKFGEADQRFRTPFLYRIVRHPLYLGFLIAFWAAPRMTVGHLLFATAMTLYIVFAIGLEETDLIGQFGSKYTEYRSRVGMLIPRLRRAR